LLKNSENEEWQKSRSRTPNFTRADIAMAGRLRNPRAANLSAAPDSRRVFYEFRQRQNCDRHKNSSFSTVFVEISYSAAGGEWPLLARL
jgi:hypothetical protein